MKDKTCIKVSHDEKLSDEDYESYFAVEIEKHKNSIKYEKKNGYECFKRIIDIIFSLLATYSNNCVNCYIIYFYCY